MPATDYLIIGSGAVGMTFADQLLTDTNANIVILDRHHMPGGHWNDAYSFVRLQSVWNKEARCYALIGPYCPQCIVALRSRSSKWKP
jgi:cation diffusion facilitator CzcD-associated flavoprotein CzcO